MPLKFIAADITTMQVDAIVVPCSPHPIIPESNSTVYSAAGDSLIAARRKLGAIPFGQSAVSPAFQLPAKYIIHTAVPMWQGGIYNETGVLRRCYETIFRIAQENDITSLALPLLGCGAQDFPYHIARNLFFDTLTSSKDMQDVSVYLVGTHQLIAEWKDIHKYISCLFTPTDVSSDISHSESSVYRVREANPSDLYRPVSLVEKDLASRLSHRNKSFSSTLLSYIEERGLKEPTVYKKANIDRKLFSKIKTNPNYQPTKATALAFALALELPLAETNEFLRTAGYTLTYSSKSDIIIEYFILKNEYDIFTINEALFAFGEPSLGSH